MSAHRTDGIARRFSSAAGGYSEAADVQRPAARFAMDLCPGGAPRRVLDIGCGTGLLTRALLARYPGAAVTAIDIAAGMLEQARRETPGAGRVSWVLADARAFVLDPPADLAVSASSLHWVAPLPKAFLAVRRSLAPRGRLVFAMMLDGSLGELRASRLAAAPRKPPAGRLPSEDEACGALRAAGFTAEAREVREVAVVHAGAAALLQALRRQGVTGGPVSSAVRPLSRSELRALASHYDAHYKEPGGGVRATYRVLGVRARVGDDAS